MIELPDGSGFAIASFPLPKDHWLYAPREYAEGAVEPIELPKPILAHEQRETVVAAIRYAVRGATFCGKETDFDPDALVQNAVYALCGPYGSIVEGKPQEEIEPVAIALHYPECWDTTAYPTVWKALEEVFSWFECRECKPQEDPRDAKIAELEAERNGVIAQSKMHTSWLDEPKERLLDALRFQGSMTAALLEETDGQRETIKRQADALEAARVIIGNLLVDGAFGDASLVSGALELIEHIAAIEQLGSGKV